MTGLIFAILTAIFFAVYIVPRKISTLKPLPFNILMGFGFSFSSIVFYIIYLAQGGSEGLFVSGMWYSLVSGLLMAFALMALVGSIDAIGIARSNQWKNLQGPIGVVLGLLFLGESASVNPVLVLVSAALIFSSATLFNIVDENESKDVNTRGILLSLVSGLAFGVNTFVVGKWLEINDGVFNYQVFLSLTILVALSLIFLVTGNKLTDIIRVSAREKALGLSSGVLFGAAFSFLVLSFARLEVSIAFTIVQLNFLGVVGIGIFYFKEIDVRGNKKRLCVGLLLALAGVLLLSFARS